ncbi:pilus assembly protein [Lysobacter enzymogenes]|uniref:pilus assembly protein n=1 Tax=Lysobacter enzymogenes TaxID=69 RepID=UPI001A9784D1|nr:PilC/PilY family type IV pilus protein [Lysobacter enzymogenes]QQP98067.1 pilus assembly protein [Lysobacter enzymogenes]
MTTSPRAYLAIPLALAVAGAGYWYYNANAIQAGGALAQAPLNSSVTIPPAFVMAVDDSGSMTFQTLFPGQDGAAYWDYASRGTNGFFTGTGASARLRVSADITSGNNGDIGPFHHTIPSNGYRIDTGRLAIPPIDNFGFARSPQYNPAYFDPNVEYSPWKRPDPLGTNAIVDYPLADTTATRVNPDNTTPTIALFTNWRTTGGGEAFDVPQGTTLPNGTVYYLNNNCGGLAGNGNWTQLNSDRELNARCAVFIQYYPATFYLRSATAGSAFGYTATPVLARNACGSGCDLYRYEIKSGNYAPGKYAAAAQNFANWFSFYGNRNRALKAAMTIALETTEQMRVGMFTINSGGGSYNYGDVTMRDMSVAADKATFYRDQLLRVGASGGTPNRYAVEHIGKQFTRTDSGAPVKLACQINAGMLFTDGYSNQGGPTIGSQDADMPAPLADGFPDTMADIAAKYYKMNLRADLPPNKVPVPDACKTTPDDPKLDCRNSPHMNFYGVTLGAKGNIYGQTYDPITNTPDPYGGWQPPWIALQNDQPSTVDEIWHATMNSRGKFINATTPAEITSAMKAILASVGGGQTPSGTLGITGARVGDNTFSVSPDYTSANNGTDWFSHLTATKGSKSGNTIVFTTAWEASQKLPVASARNIRFAKAADGSVRPTLADFNAAAIGGSDAQILAALCSDALQNCAGKFNRITGGVTGTEAVAYLRGDPSLETTKLRKRTTRLGDIVNSSPIVSARGDDYGYAYLRGADGVSLDPLNYANYLKTKADSLRAPYVYVGANDGMFHAFNGDSGEEAFAFIPSTSLGHMGNLLFPYRASDRNDQVFQHRYYVDGLVTVSDYYDSAWSTAVVAASGAGGRSVFSMDVGTAGNFRLLWELSDRSGDANGAKDIGNVLGKIAIVPVKDAAGVVRWKAIFGNGYDSVNGKAVLFVVDVATGAVTRITAQETTGTLPTRTKNGLGNVIVTDQYQGTTNDKARDGYADTVYGGDLNGAVWKFDLRSNTVALGGQPLFIARYNDNYALRQPILGGFEAVASGNDVMLLFGTGSFSFVEDPTDRAMQSFYGIIDRGVSVTGRSQLQMQYAYEDKTATGAILRQTTKVRLDAAKMGWYINMGVDQNGNGNPIATGERFVGFPRVQNGTIFFTTYDPSNTDSCATTGANWLYGLTALSGASNLSAGRLDSPTGEQLGNDTGAIKTTGGGGGGGGPNKEVGVFTTGGGNILSAGATKEEIEAAMAARCSVVVQTAGARPVYLPRPCGRQSWRQIR